MKVGDPIEEQCVRLWSIVYGNVAHTFEDSRRAFWNQEPMIITGWERLARSMSLVTTAKTIEYVMSNDPRAKI